MIVLVDSCVSVGQALVHAPSDKSIATSSERVVRFVCFECVKHEQAKSEQTLRPRS